MEYIYKNQTGYLDSKELKALPERLRGLHAPDSMRPTTLDYAADAIEMQRAEVERLRAEVEALKGKLAKASEDEADMFWDDDDPELFRGDYMEDAIRDISDTWGTADGEWFEINLQRAIKLSSVKVRARYVGDDLEYEVIDAARQRTGDTQ